MKSKVGSAVVLATLLMSICSVVNAKSAKTETIIDAGDKVSFATGVAQVKGEMAPGGRFEYLDSLERDQVNTRLNDMQALYDKFGTVQQMDQTSKVRLFDDQEAVNATLTRRDGTRLVCTNDAPIGSHIPRTVCHPYSEVEQAHLESQKVLQNTLKMPSTHKPGG